MERVAPFESNLPKPVILAGAGIIYIVAGLTQTWFWFDQFYMKHSDYVPYLLHGVLHAKQIGDFFWYSIIAFFLLFFWGAAADLLYVGTRLILLSNARGTRIYILRSQHLVLTMALCCLSVSLLLTFHFAPLIPLMKSVPLFIATLGVLMGSYGYLACVYFHAKKQS